MRRVLLTDGLLPHVDFIFVPEAMLAPWRDCICLAYASWPCPRCHQVCLRAPSGLCCSRALGCSRATSWWSASPSGQRDLAGLLSWGDADCKDAGSLLAMCRRLTASPPARRACARMHAGLGIPFHCSPQGLVLYNLPGRARPRPTQATKRASCHAGVVLQPALPAETLGGPSA